MSKSRERQKARRMLVQALYSWDVGGTDLETIEAEFHADNNMTKVDSKLFHNILFGVPKNLAEVDGTFEPHLDRENKQLDPVSRAVLRLSSFEMLYIASMYPIRWLSMKGLIWLKPTDLPTPLNLLMVY